MSDTTKKTRLLFLETFANALHSQISWGKLVNCVLKGDDSCVFPKLKTPVTPESVVTVLSSAPKREEPQLKRDTVTVLREWHLTSVKNSPDAALPFNTSKQKTEKLVKFSRETQNVHRHLKTSTTRWRPFVFHDPKIVTNHRGVVRSKI